MSYNLPALLTYVEKDAYFLVDIIIFVTFCLFPRNLCQLGFILFIVIWTHSLIEMQRVVQEIIHTEKFGYLKSLSFLKFRHVVIKLCKVCWLCFVRVCYIWSEDNNIKYDIYKISLLIYNEYYEDNLRLIDWIKIVRY